MTIESSGRENSRRQGMPLGQIVPIIFISIILLVPWVTVNLLQSPSPFYRYYDPEIQYFMNSLLAFKGHTYYYLDHPGTPLEVIGTMILAITYPLTAGKPGGFVEYQLRNPNLFLLLARLFLTACSIGCAIFMHKTLAASARKLADVLLAVAVPLMFYARHPEA